MAPVLAGLGGAEGIVPPFRLANFHGTLYLLPPFPDCLSARSNLLGRLIGLMLDLVKRWTLAKHAVRDGDGPICSFDTLCATCPVVWKLHWCINKLAMSWLAGSLPGMLYAPSRTHS